MAAPRQLGAAASAAPAGDLLLGGVSSFAFQGTNAHALLGKQLGSASRFALPGPAGAFLAAAAVQCARFWVLPAAHPLISCGAVGAAGSKGAARRAVAFDCHLLEPRLAAYSDHVVLGRALFPGAGMLEAALAAGMTVLEGTAGGPDSGVLTVSGLAITAPLVMAHPREEPQGRKQGQQRSGAVLRCSLDPASGDLQLVHAERPGSRRSTPIAHGCLRLAAAAATAVAVHAAAAVAVQTLAVKRLLLSRAMAALTPSPPTKAEPASGHATGSIISDSRHSTDGYLVPPPCMDACLHLGVAAPGCGAKVPVAVGSFALVDRRSAAACGELAGSTSAAHAVPAGQADTSSFALCPPAGSTLASLADLHTRVSKPKSAVGQTPAAASVKPADFVYEVAWQAAEQAPAGRQSAVLIQPAASALLAVGGGSAQVDLAAGTPHSAASAALHLLQRAQAVQAPAVEVAMADVLSDGSPAAGAASGARVLAASALEGLLRVAATEHAATAYTLAASDSLSLGVAAQEAHSNGAGKQRGILQAVRTRRRVRTTPRLLPR